MLFSISIDIESSKTLPTRFSHQPRYHHKELPFVEEDYLQPTSSGKKANYMELMLMDPESASDSAGIHLITQSI